MNTLAHKNGPWTRSPMQPVHPRMYSISSSWTGETCVPSGCTNCDDLIREYFEFSRIGQNTADDLQGSPAAIAENRHSNYSKTSLSGGMWRKRSWRTFLTSNTLDSPFRQTETSESNLSPDGSSQSKIRTAVANLGLRAPKVRTNQLPWY